MIHLDRQSALLYTRAALRILEQNLRLYRQDEPACYRVVAVQLRLLLCDTNRIHDRLVDISLVPRIFPDLALDRIAMLTPDVETGLPRLVFREKGVPLPLQSWLAQPLPAPWGKPVSLRELIRTVCEQDGGAHVDQRSLADLRAWKERGDHIAAIGQYILSVLDPMVAAEEN
jgi:hypothetical protein